MSDEEKAVLVCPTIVKHDSIGLQGGHWMSYSMYGGPVDVLNGQICVISVVLDAGAHTSFSGVRTLVVGEVTRELDEARIQDWIENPYFQRYDSFLFPGNPKSSSDPKRYNYRTALASRKSAKERSKKLLESNTDTLLPLCTIVLELSDTSNDNWLSVGLNLRHEGFLTQKPLRILYDHAELFAPAQRSSISVLRLSSSHSFAGIPQPTVTGMLLRGPKGTPTHCIRILPLDICRSSPKLPFEVVRRIAHHAFKGKNPGFCSSLLSFAMVCKAWSPIADMFWESLGTLAPCERPYASSVSRALSKKPEKAKLVKCFSPWDYRVDNDNKQLFHFHEAHMAILQMVTSVKTINISSIDLPLVEPILTVMPTLSSIERCVINDRPHLDNPVGTPDSTPPPPGYYLNISDIVKILPHWKNLRVLHFFQHRGVEPSGKDEESEPDASSANNCKIEELYLQNVDGIGPQLLQFVSPSHSTLQKVELHGLHGLSNHHLLSFLSQTSSTIRKIILTGCDVIRDSEDEEYVFDAVIQKMASLYYAYIGGTNLASLLTITEKPRCTSPSMISLELATSCQIDVGQILEALQTTTWHAIRLVHPEFLNWNTEMCGRIYDMARQTGVSIVLHPSPLSP